MTCLLDTHVILWWLEGSDELSEEAKGVIVDPAHRMLISTASMWEINIKMGIGKLRVNKNYAEILVADGFEILDMQLPHVMKILELPSIHNDPFDRILIGKAMVEQATIISRDKKITQYPVDFILA